MILNCINTSDYILIGTALFLGIVALFVPYLAELLKRKLFKPILKITFKLKPPDCHKTYWNDTPEEVKSVYYFRFEIKNIGKTTCRNVENSIENIWQLNSAKIPIRIEDFTPVNLAWSLNYKIVQQNINPDRKLYCNIGHLPTKTYQQSKQKLINPRGYDGNALRLVFDFVSVLNVQLNCLPPGSYIIQINTYSENHKTLKTFFKIDWSGNWNDDQNTMFQELVINKTKRPNE